jgi:hypothetical protein
MPADVWEMTAIDKETNFVAWIHWLTHTPARAPRCMPITTVAQPGFIGQTTVMIEPLGRRDAHPASKELFGGLLVGKAPAGLSDRIHFVRKTNQ